jgi:hypothetical protein
VHGIDSHSKGNDNNEEKQPVSSRDGVNVEMPYSYLFICWSWACWLSPKIHILRLPASISVSSLYGWSGSARQEN